MFVLGGWRNTKSVLARQEEHGPNVAERSAPHVEPGRRYHWLIQRKGGDISWNIDGAPFLTFKDPAPLRGPSHAYFAFSGWESLVHFDNLRIR